MSGGVVGGKRNLLTLTSLAINFQLIGSFCLARGGKMVASQFITINI